MNEARRRKIVREPRFERELKKVLAATPRADEAFRGFEAVVARRPEMGMTAPGRPRCSCVPVHTESKFFLVVYTYDARKVVCLAVREVPSGPY